MSDQPAPSPEQTPTPTPETTPTPTPEAAAEPASLLGSEQKPEEAPFDPEKLTLPEGFEKNEVFEEFSTFAKESGLSGHVAQKLIDMHAKAAKTAVEALTSGWEKQQADWQKEVMADKEIGGDKFDSVRQTFAKVADNAELSDPEFRNALDFTGAGNHPAVIRTLARWAKALSEGGPVQGQAPNRLSNGQVQPPATLGTAIYGPDGPHTGGPKLS